MGKNVNEIRFSIDPDGENDLSDQDAKIVITDKNKGFDMCFMNKGYYDSSCSREDTSKKIKMPTPRLRKTVTISEEPPKMTNVYSENNGLEDGPQNTNKGTVPLAHDTAAIDSTSSENQITELDEVANGVVAVNMDTNEKKRKVQLVGWDSRKTSIFLGFILAFDLWALLFYCFKNGIVPNIFN